MMTRELVRIPDFVEGCVVEHALCAAVSAAAAVPTAAAVCARRRAAETREAMMSRSGCKESKVATGAFAAPTQQHQHTPSSTLFSPLPAQRKWKTAWKKERH